MPILHIQNNVLYQGKFCDFKSLYMTHIPKCMEYVTISLIQPTQ